MSTWKLERKSRERTDYTFQLLLLLLSLCALVFQDRTHLYYMG